MNHFPSETRSDEPSETGVESSAAEQNQQQALHEARNSVHSILEAVTSERPLAWIFINWNIEEKKVGGWSEKLPGMAFGSWLGGPVGEMIFGGTLISKGSCTYSGELGLLVVTEGTIHIAHFNAPFQNGDGSIVQDHLGLFQAQLEAKTIARKTFNIRHTQVSGSLDAGASISLLCGETSVSLRKSELYVNDLSLEFSSSGDIHNHIAEQGPLATPAGFATKLLGGENPISEDQFVHVEKDENYIAAIFLSIISHSQRDTLIEKFPCLPVPLQDVLTERMRTKGSFARNAQTQLVTAGLLALISMAGLLLSGVFILAAVGGLIWSAIALVNLSRSIWCLELFAREAGSKPLSKNVTPNAVASVPRVQEDFFGRLVEIVVGKSPVIYARSVSLQNALGAKSRRLFELFRSKYISGKNYGRLSRSPDANNANIALCSPSEPLRADAHERYVTESATNPPLHSRTGEIPIKNLTANDKPKGMIRFVLLVVSLPSAPNASQTFEFLNKILPELESQQDGTAKIGTLWEKTPIEAIDMSAKLVEAFGAPVANNDLYVFRTLTIGLPSGGAKCLVVYDKIIEAPRPQSAIDQAGPSPRAPSSATSQSVHSDKRCNLSPGQAVPVTGVYYCNFCSSVKSSLTESDALASYAAKKGLSSRDLASVFAIAGLGGGVQKAKFTKGDRFGLCPECRNAASWRLESEAPSVTPSKPPPPPSDDILRERREAKKQLEAQKKSVALGSHKFTNDICLLCGLSTAVVSESKICCTEELQREYQVLSPSSLPSVTAVPQPAPPLNL